MTPRVPWASPSPVSSGKPQWCSSHSEVSSSRSACSAGIKLSSSTACSSRRPDCGPTRGAEESGALDLGKVAIRGWSFSGFLAALAVLRRPDVFHAAVAGAPVTDQRLYDTHWRERHLGHPDEHPEAYDRCSPILEAASLRRPLLLVHGLADDNVFAAHTLRFSAALLAAGRPHEVLPLPRTTHMPADEAVTENLLLHQLDFLQRALGLPRALGLRPDQRP